MRAAAIVVTDADRQALNKFLGNVTADTPPTEDEALALMAHFRSIFDRIERALDKTAVEFVDNRPAEPERRSLGQTVRELAFGNGPRPARALRCLVCGAVQVGGKCQTCAPEPAS